MERISGAGAFNNSSDATLQRLLPEPKSRLNVNFGTVLGSVVGGLSNAVGRAGLMTGEMGASLDPSYVALINKQIETQQQMQLVSMESNIEKSKHETQMAAIRNVRVG